LLLFVAASIVVLTVKSLRQGPQAAAAQQQRDRTIAYYFHGKVRCPTCESIEAYAHEAVSGGFAAELGDGRIDWQVVDFEQPGNEHFAKDFELAAPSVVLVEIRGGACKRWKNLPEVWELVGDKPAFVAFVQKEVRAFLNQPDSVRAQTADRADRQGSRQ
jgi:hypothetical protein